MAKGPEITDEVRMLAAKLHKEHPKWTNEEIRNWVLHTVHKENPSLPEGWPSKYSIDRIMPGIRERVRRSELEPDPLDKPWTIQSMSRSEYYIPPEALPSVLQVWYFYKDYDRTLTIREAQWVARLYAAIKDTENLCWHATFKAGVEKFAEDAGIEDYMGSESDNLSVYSTMTGHIITREEDKRISGYSDEQLRQMKKVWPIVQEASKAAKQEGAKTLRSGIHFERPMIFEETEPSQKEAKNERKHKRSKNEGRHNKTR